MKLLSFLSTIAVTLFTQCNQSNSQTQPNKETMKTDESIISNTSVVTGNNHFANDLLKNYIHSEEQKNKNIFFSPFSIYTALAMTGEGAKNQTAAEIQKVLHLPENDSVRQTEMAKLITSLNTNSSNYKLSVANAIWAQKSYSFLPAFMDVTKASYSAKAENLDFIQQPEASRKIINNWVEEHTNNKIKDLLAEGNITKATRLILTNAVYFKADWAQAFESEYTQEADFTTSSGTKVKAELMNIQHGFYYSETNEAQVVELPYKGEELSMVIILPKRGMMWRQWAILQTL